MIDGAGGLLARKLGITEGSVVALLDVPDEISLELPPGVKVKRRAQGRADVVLACFTSLSRLERRLDALSPMIFPAGGLWVSWPKRTSGIPTNLSDLVVRRSVLDRGLVDNKVCAVDETWSALRFVWRLADRR